MQAGRRPRQGLGGCAWFAPLSVAIGPSGYCAKRYFGRPEFAPVFGSFWRAGLRRGLPAGLRLAGGSRAGGSRAGLCGGRRFCFFRGGFGCARAGGRGKGFARVALAVLLQKARQAPQGFAQVVFIREEDEAVVW